MAKEPRIGGEFLECVDCDVAMDSSSGSTPFLDGGGLLGVRRIKQHIELVLVLRKLQNTVLQVSSLVSPNTTRRLAYNHSSRKQTPIVNTQS